MSIYYKIQSKLRLPIPIFIKKYFKKYYGKNLLDKKIKNYLNYDNGYFVELGAYDGITQSNTFYFEKKKNWEGILIEPSKKNIKECVKNRSSKNKYYNNACVSFDYKKKNIELVYSGLKTFSKKFLSIKLQSEYFMKPEIKRGENIFYFKAKTMTMNSILIKSKAPKLIDLLSLDTEGAEFEVLKGVNFKEFNFRFILVETNYIKKMKDFLKKKKYKYIKKFNENDYLFKLN